MSHRTVILHQKEDLPAGSFCAYPTTERVPRTRPKVIKGDGQTKLRWTEEEIQQFIDTIKVLGLKSNEKGKLKATKLNWEKLSSKTGKTVQQCRNYWSDCKKQSSLKKSITYQKLLSATKWKPPAQ